jgi:hypothetical protein
LGACPSCPSWLSVGCSPAPAAWLPCICIIGHSPSRSSASCAGSFRGEHEARAAFYVLGDSTGVHHALAVVVLGHVRDACAQLVIIALPPPPCPDVVEGAAHAESAAATSAAANSNEQAARTRSALRSMSSSLAQHRESCRLRLGLLARLHGDLLRLGLGPLGHRNGEHAVLELGPDVLGVDTIRQREGARE